MNPFVPENEPAAAEEAFASGEDAGLRLLLVEDSDDDAELLRYRLQKSGLKFSLVYVEDEEGFRRELQQPVDLVISDFSVPQFGALPALAILREEYPDIPLLIVSGAIGEETAVAAMKQGAIDYLQKDRLARLPQAVQQGVEAARMQVRLRRKREDLAKAHEHLAGLSARLVEAQEAERRNLAHELHDELGQRLTVLNIILHRLKGYLHEPAGCDAWMQASAEVAGLMAQVRELSGSLRPPALDHMGFEAAVRQLLGRQFDGSATAWTFGCEGLPERMADAISITAYRLVQESTTNIVRHAAAAHAAVSVLSDGPREQLHIEIRDDGCGFDAARRQGNGLPGMEERVRLLGGDLHILSSPGKGTIVSASLPLKCDGAAEGACGLVPATG